jgi:hypothetical protein
VLFLREGFHVPIDSLFMDQRTVEHPSSTSSASFGTTSSKITDLIRFSREGCQVVPWRRPKCLGSFAGKAAAPPLQLAPAPSRRGVRAIAGAGCLPNVAVPPNLDGGFLAAS